DGLPRVFELLAQHHRLTQAEVALLDERGERTIVARFGDTLPAHEQRARVHVERLGPTSTSLSVPIAIEKKVAGHFTAVFEHEPEADIERALQLLRAIGSIIALRAHRHGEGRLLEENRTLRRELVERYELQHLVGSTGPMRQVVDQIAQVASGTTTV